MTKIFQESGVSETVGALVLIAIISLGISIAAIVLMSNPVPEQIPSVNANFSFNQTDGILIIHHNGGDTLNRDEIYLMVDTGGGVVEKNAYSISDGSNRWSIGNDIMLPLSSPPLTVALVYKGSGGGSVLASADQVTFGMPSSDPYLMDL